MFKVLILLFCSCVLGSRLRCTNRTASLHLEKNSYFFSLRLVDRVAQQTNGHFVFSPLLTWVQLMALAEGARGETLKEIVYVTRYPHMKCFKNKLRGLLKSVQNEMSGMGKRQSLFLIDLLLDVKDSFKKRVGYFYGTRVITLNFRDERKSAVDINKIIERKMKRVITKALDAEDFVNTLFLMSDTVYMKADWRSPFNPANTKIEPFYAEENVPIGNVNMMQQMGYFNITDIPSIDARVLELPFNNRISMMVILPTRGSAMDLYFAMQKINMTTIYDSFGTTGDKLVNVKLPRFKTTSHLDNIPELVYDMGVHRAFYQDLADFIRISDFKMHASMMMQIVDIEAVERGVSLTIQPESLRRPDNPTDFTLNKPFAYLIVDRRTKLILISGIYSKPSVY